MIDTDEGNYIMLAIEKLINSLNSILADNDAKVLEDTKKRIFERRSKMYAYKRERTNNREAGETYRTYMDNLYEICGGKTWYNIIDGRTEEDLIKIIEKNCENVVKKRNTSIAKKLQKAGIVEVLEEKFVETHDGYNGIFKIDTDSGIKTVTIETILAGGYAIQCLHQRVLVKVK